MGNVHTVKKVLPNLSITSVIESNELKIILKIVTEAIIRHTKGDVGVSPGKV